MAKTTAAADPAAEENKTEKVTQIRRGPAADTQLEKPKSLAAKLSALTGEISNVPKNGWNDFHKYAYVKESDLAEAVRGLLAKYNVMIFPTLEGEVQHEGEAPIEGKKKADRLAKLVMTYTFVDGDTGEERVVRFPGWGEDKGDKGVYKAITGSEKYFLMKTFLISSNDDPENDDSAGNNNGGGSNGGGNSGGDGNQQTQDPVQVAAPARYFGVQELPKANGNGKYKAHVFVVAFNGDKNNTATVQMFANANAPTQENVLEDISQKDADSAAIEKGVPCDAVVTKEGRYWNMVKYGPRQQQQQQQQES